MLSTSAELRVEIERRRQRVVAEPAEHGADRVARRIAGDLGQRAAHQAMPQSVTEQPAHRELALHRITRAAASAAPARTPAACARPASRPATAPARQVLPRRGERRRAVLPVAAEQLVGALAGQRDGHVLRRELGQREEAERGQLGDGLVQAPDQILERDALVRHRELDLVVVGAEQLGDATRVRELVALAVLDEADREGLHRLAVRARHQRDDQAGVEPAAEHRAERHVAHQPQPDGAVELLEQPLAVLVDARAASRSCPAAAPDTPSTARRATRRRSTTSRWPGGSLLTPASGVSGAGK